MDGAALHAIAPREGAQIRFMTAGSVDDGKSTLIGRLLLDSGALMRDQSVLVGDDGADLAALTDGLEAERAQGITIDVAYRYFATPRASFVIADAPGHEQYTRNMVTAASVSDVAVLVVDATRVENDALRPQTRRHAAIAALLGLDLIVAVNKMDALDWSKARFEAVRDAIIEACDALGFADVACVPVSARWGDNVVRRGAPSWWSGPTLLEHIEMSRSRAERVNAPLRLPVQVVLRALGARFYAGRLASGVVHVGEQVFVGPQRTPATVARIQIADRSVPQAQAGESVTVELEEERDIARGDVIASGDVSYVRRVVADLCWLDEDAWVPGRRYLLRQGTLETQALIEDVHFVRDVADFGKRAKPGRLELNDIANVRIATRDPILADRYGELPRTGAFVLLDPQTNQTCAAGMIREAAP